MPPRKETFQHINSEQTSHRDKVTWKTLTVTCIASDVEPLNHGTIQANFEPLDLSMNMPTQQRGLIRSSVTGNPLLAQELARNRDVKVPCSQSSSSAKFMCTPAQPIVIKPTLPENHPLLAKELASFEVQNNVSDCATKKTDVKEPRAGNFLF